MSEKFTPGPWRVEKDTTLVWGECLEGTMGFPVADATTDTYRSWGRRFSEGERDANALLIASAPDLYEALKALREEVGKLKAAPDGWGRMIAALCIADDVLAKARGEGSDNLQQERVSQ